MESYDILVIILSVALLFSLIVWISVGILFVQIMRKFKTASQTAQQAVENVEAFTSQLKNVGKATAFGSVVAQVTRAFKGRK